jgi:hypothetical protein
MSGSELSRRVLQIGGPKNVGIITLFAFVESDSSTTGKFGRLGICSTYVGYNPLYGRLARDRGAAGDPVVKICANGYARQPAVRYWVESVGYSRPRTALRAAPRRAPGSPDQR